MSEFIVMVQVLSMKGPALLCTETEVRKHNNFYVETIYKRGRMDVMDGAGDGGGSARW